MDISRLGGDIIYFLEPYNETSTKKRVLRRSKVYFADTRLAVYLARVKSIEILQASFLNGSFIETYIINEIRKSYLNNGINPNFYYYRDSYMDEIDLIIIDDGKLYRIECKAGMRFNLSDVKAFKCLNNTKYIIGTSCIICNSDTVYLLDENIFVLPLSGI